MIPFRKKNTPVDFSGLYADMHSHLIPGIDDGVPDVEGALQMVQGLSQLGYRKIITTPHIMWDVYKNTSGIIQAGWEKVHQALEDRKIPVDFHAAAEYYVDDHFDQLLEHDSRLLTIRDNMVLIELSFVQEPTELKRIIFKLQIKGYQPIIAHPERYLYFGAEKTWYDELRNAGCIFQVNLLSLVGYYGKPAMELGQYLIRKKYVDLLGTDLHHSQHLQALQHYPSMDLIKKLLDSGVIQNHLL